MLLYDQKVDAGLVERLRDLLSRSSIVSPARPSRHAFFDAVRRMGWFTERITSKRAFNLLLGLSDLLTGRRRTHAFPAIVKIDISPLCNLKCTACVHAYPGEDQALEEQEFNSRQIMSVDQYRHIIKQLAKKTSAVSLYYLGDPLVHPHLNELCRIAYDAGLNVHISTNFSFGLSDERIESLVRSGVTHLTVCIDGMTQEAYAKTRVGGRIDQVVDNLKRVCQARTRLRRRLPSIEVQYIKYRHNVHQIAEAEALCTDLGVDQFTTFWGNLHNYVDRGLSNYQVYEPKTALPVGTRCHWPFTATLIKYNGDVIPCCNHRLDEQYRSTAESPVLGNVFEQSIEDIWNSPEYQQIRRFVRDPQILQSEEEVADTFCYGCVRLFDTTCEQDAERAGHEYDYEELFIADSRGRPVRRLRVV